MRRVLSKFFADRGTHLAAMIAYFALLSFVPLLFLALAVLGLVNQADEGSFFVRELSKTFPNTSLPSILRAVRAIQENATALGIVGVVVRAAGARRRCYTASPAERSGRS